MTPRVGDAARDAREPLLARQQGYGRPRDEAEAELSRLEREEE